MSKKKEKQKNDNEENKKSRAFAIVLYPQEDASHYSALIKICDFYQYAFIEHTKDIYEEDGEDHVKGELKKSHIHVILKFDNARHKSKIAKELGINENYIQKANFVAYTRYLIHKDDPTKFQYEEKNIFTNIPKEVHSAITLKGDYKRNNTNIVLEYINNNRHTSFYNLVMWAKENGQLEEISKNAYLYKNITRS